MRVLLACQTASGGTALRQTLANLYSLPDLTQNRPGGATSAGEYVKLLSDGTLPDSFVQQIGYYPSAPLLAAARDAGCCIIATIRNPYDCFAALHRSANCMPRLVSGSRSAVLSGHFSGDPEVLDFIRQDFGRHLRMASSWTRSASHVVRYEDLFRNSLAALARITSWLGEIPAANLRYAADHLLEPALAPPENSIAFQIDSYICYRSALSPAAISCLTEAHGAVIVGLGYRSVAVPEPEADELAAPQPEMASPPPAVDRGGPFFVVGSVRSGTTMLRDLLRLHPRLECPEETHFFRWGDPYGSPRFMGFYTQNKLMQAQREQDGISEDAFAQLLDRAATRRELAEGYGRLHCAHLGKRDARWFDKTPQNVYGMLLIKALFPQTLFVHIHRNPLNVVASLLEGRVLPEQSLVGAINFWVEAVEIIHQFKAAWPQQLIEVSYEELTANPRRVLVDLLETLGEDADALRLEQASFKIHGERNRYREVLNAKQVTQVVAACEPYMSWYGYESTPRRRRSRLWGALKRI